MVSAHDPSNRLAFAHLNLRRNPFGEPDRRERASLAEVDLGSLADSLRKPGFVVQLIGEHGVGKTTHLLALYSHFPHAPYVRFRPEEKVGRIPRGHPLFLDETELLSPLSRWFLFRRKVSFAIASHMDHSHEFSRGGLTVETLYPAALMTRKRLAQLLSRRIQWARRGPGPVPVISAQTVTTLLTELGTDVRAMEDRLYTVFQNLKEVCFV